MTNSPFEWRNGQLTNNPLYIDCEINHPEFGWIPFTAYRDDVHQHCSDMWSVLDLMRGTLAPPSMTIEEQTSDEVNLRRNSLLVMTDWTQGSDVPQATKDKWAPYRQALRDITDQPGYPMNVDWPEEPA